MRGTGSILSVFLSAILAALPESAALITAGIERLGHYASSKTDAAGACRLAVDRYGPTGAEGAGFYRAD